MFFFLATTLEMLVGIVCMLVKNYVNGQKKYICCSTSPGSIPGHHYLFYPKGK